MIKGQENQENQMFSKLLDAFLHDRQRDYAVVDLNHLDEDQLSTFVEGNLNERESKPILRHLIDCGACRKITAQLARLTIESEAATEVVNIKGQQHSRLQQFLQSFNLISVGSADEAVFAHNDSSKENDAVKDETLAAEESKDKNEK